MVIANILNTYTTVAGLWQYDYGQILRLQGIKLPTAVEIHFSLQEKGGESVTRIGTTKDGVTDVVIPDSMLENDATTMDYKIYAFIYLADSESGQTEYKISMSVKSRPKPEGFEKPEDAELFRQAITEVNNSAEVALQSKKEAEAWAHGHVEYADRDEDNAKYYAKQAKDEAEKIQGKVKEGKEEIDRYIKENRNDLKGEIGKVETSRAAVELCKQEVESAQADVEQMRQDTQQAAQNASDANAEAQQAVQQAEASRSAAQTSEQNAAASRDFANTYKEAAETAKSAAETAAQNASESKTAAETAAQNAAQSKTDIDNIKSDIEEAAKGENVTQIQKNMNDIGQLKESVNDLKSSGANNESLIVIYDILSKGTYTEDISSLMSQLDGLVHDGMYKITSDVKNATLSNKSNYVAKGSKYTCTVTASLGYKISAVVVTMGGIDISSNYDTTTKTITIESVTGPINITITTIESDYTSLQYIKGDGNSWIDTGVVANVNHRYELSAKLDGDDADECFFGADQYNVGSAYNQFIMVAKENHTKITGTINKNGNIDVGSWNKTENNLLSNKKMYLVVKNGSQEIYLNSSYTEKQTQYIAGSASFGAQDTLPIIPLYLFHVNTTASTNSNNASRYKRSKITVYWLKIYDDTTNEMLHEFLPVAKNGKIGMFDTVTKEFHANIGTGTFAYEEA